MEKECLTVPQRKWDRAAAWRDFGIGLMILEMEWKRGSGTFQSNQNYSVPWYPNGLLPHLFEVAQMSHFLNEACSDPFYKLLYSSTFSFL